jgi:NAD(P)-dependent dehydrogenase (short-subunit alcohol dehydrogenase family)
MEITGRTAVITGGGSGIGKATARLLAARGATVVLVDIDESLGTAAAAEVAAAGGRAEFVRADVTTDEGIQAGIERAAALGGRLDIMFNNAGILTGAPRFPDTPTEQWSRVVQLNFWSVIRGTQLAFQSMRSTGGGVIVNTASMAGINPWPMDPVYSATKGGVVFFTKALAALAESDGVRVNCVCPTLVETPLLTGASDRTIAGLIRMTRLKPEDVAAAVLRLVEDDSAAGKALTVLPDAEPAFA